MDDEALVEYWLASLEDRLRPSSVRAYRSVVRTHLIPWLGWFRMADLDGRCGVATVQRAVDAISRQQLAGGELIAPGTVRRAVAVLRSALSEARRQRLVSSNAAWRLRLPQGARPYAVAWTRELSVERQLLLVDGVVHVGPPKSAAGVRALALDEVTNQLLREQRRSQQARFTGTGRNPDGYLFIQADGRPVRPDWLTHRFRVLVRRFDLPPVRFHDLRHGAASLAGAAGVELKVSSTTSVTPTPSRPRTRIGRCFGSSRIAP